MPFAICIQLRATVWEVSILFNNLTCSLFGQGTVAQAALDSMGWA